MSEVQQVIANVLTVHRFYYSAISTSHGCTCGNWHDVGHGGSRDEYTAHVAESIDAALGGLTREWIARHASGGGRGGFQTLADAERHTVENPPRPAGVESPPDPGYVGVEARWVGQWIPKEAGSPENEALRA